jgi:hypothetical protein
VIADADNYYTKHQVDELIEDIDVSGVTSADVETMIEEAVSGMATEEFVSGYTYDKATIDEKVASGGTFDPTLYYQKSETSSKTEIDSALADKLAVSAFTTYSGTVASELGEKASQSDVDTLSGQIQSISSSTSGDVTVISGDVVTISGDVTTISGDVVTISGDVTTISGDVVTISGDVVTISGDVQTLTNDLTAHTSNASIHVTTAQTASWDAKSNFSGSYNDLTDKPTIPSIWSGTEAQWSQISGGTLDNNTLYLVY